MLVLNFRFQELLINWFHRKSNFFASFFAGFLPLCFIHADITYSRQLILGCLMFLQHPDSKITSSDAATCWRLAWYSAPCQHLISRARRGRAPSASAAATDGDSGSGHQNTSMWVYLNATSTLASSPLAAAAWRGCKLLIPWRGWNGWERVQGSLCHWLWTIAILSASSWICCYLFAGTYTV